MIFAPIEGGYVISSKIGMTMELSGCSREQIESLRELILSVSSLMHTFNNQLFAVSGKAQLLADEIENKQIQADLDLFVSKIETASEHLQDAYGVSRRYRANFESDTESDPASGSKRGFKPNLSILLANSSFMNLEILMDLLEDEGHNVSCAQNAAVLEEQISTRDFDFFILDEDHPVKNLGEAMAEVLSESPRTQIIVMSDDCQTPYPDHVAIVSKPVDISTLRPLLNAKLKPDRSNDE